MVHIRGGALSWTWSAALLLVTYPEMTNSLISLLLRGWRVSFGHNRFEWLSQKHIKVFKDGYWVNYPLIWCLFQYKRLQLRSNQQEAALRRQEQQMNRLKARLSDRPRDKAPCETDQHSDSKIFKFHIFWNHSAVFIFLCSHRCVEHSPRRASQRGRAHQVFQTCCEVYWLLS